MKVSGQEPHMSPAVYSSLSDFPPAEGQPNQAPRQSMLSDISQATVTWEPVNGERTYNQSQS